MTNNILGAKNLALLKPSTGANKGVNFSCTDGMTISVNGRSTGTSNSIYSFNLVNTIEGDLIISLTPSSQKISLTYYNGANWNNVPSNGQINGSISLIGFEIAPNQTIDETVKLMIRPVGTDSTYVPYAKTNVELTNRVQDKVLGLWQYTDNNPYNVWTEHTATFSGFTTIKSVVISMLNSTVMSDGIQHEVELITWSNNSVTYAVKGGWSGGMAGVTVSFIICGE